MADCIKCGRELTPDDIGFHKKMINRGAQQFMCIECVSEYFDMTVERSRALIERFRESGCTLFVK